MKTGKNNIYCPTRPPPLLYRGISVLCAVLAFICISFCLLLIFFALIRDPAQRLAPWILPH
ncbi:hypothetical protein BC828DRAFT_381155 [Blastocladiella britannica]|nr:hypothetical protein BC828DRAFT_381155 [Blastocladiella britannica]